ncbi:hypothetical protein F2P56_033984 [Juglans regia]|uniref:Uncharacterized protein n=1 Tax=Juglans regia TaxID=51240 RepID=A0A833WTN7_JUGRE|nr:hypothetical protein F2P56_033984 [Juglans regia]
MHSFRSRTPMEVKECGVHLVCPDDANSKFYNSIAPFGRSESSNSDFHRQFYFTLYQKPPDFSDELEVFITSQIDKGMQSIDHPSFSSLSCFWLSMKQTSWQTLSQGVQKSYKRCPSLGQVLISY